MVGGYIYVGQSRRLHSVKADHNSFLKLDTNLNKIWEYDLGSNEVRGAAVLDSAGNIYFPVEVGKIGTSIDQASLHIYSISNAGTLRWSQQIVTPEGLGSVGPFNFAISSNDIIYAGGDRMHAFDTSGNLIWSYKWARSDNMYIQAGAIIDSSNNIYFCNANSAEVYSLDVNGNLRWSTVVADNTTSSGPSFSTDQSKIIFAIYKTVGCLNASDGSLVWRYKPPVIDGTPKGFFQATPAVDDHNNVYLGTKGDADSSYFFAIKADGSGLLWQINNGADLYCSPCLGNDRKVYVGSEWNTIFTSTRIHAFDMATGTTEWEANLIADIDWSSPVLDSNGYLYVGTKGFESAGSTEDTNPGRFYKIRTDSTGLLASAGSARYHGGNDNTGRR